MCYLVAECFHLPWQQRGLHVSQAKAAGAVGTYGPNLWRYKTSIKLVVAKRGAIRMSLIHFIVLNNEYHIKSTENTLRRTYTYYVCRMIYEHDVMITLFFVSLTSSLALTSSASLPRLPKTQARRTEERKDRSNRENRVQGPRSILDSDGSIIMHCTRSGWVCQEGSQMSVSVKHFHILQI